MKETCCDFCGREKDYSELIPYGKARICGVCKEEQIRNHQRGKIIKRDINL